MIFGDPGPCPVCDAPHTSCVGPSPDSLQVQRMKARVLTNARGKTISAPLQRPRSLTMPQNKGATTYSEGQEPRVHPVANNREDVVVTESGHAISAELLKQNEEAIKAAESAVPESEFQKKEDAARAKKAGKGQNKVHTATRVNEHGETETREFTQAEWRKRDKSEGWERQDGETDESEPA